MVMITLDGRSLTLEQLAAIARGNEKVAVDPSTNERVARAEELIAKIVENYRRAYEAGEPAPREYGVTTGFGEFKDKPIAPDTLEQLQRNLLLSHSAGVGEPFPAEVVRAVLATRLNSFLQGHSGVRALLIRVLTEMLNRGAIPIVPIRGSVGASGDLCPLSHTFATLLGEREFYVAPALSRREESDTPAGAPAPRLRPASELAGFLGFDAEEIKPTFKEGLALVNGVNFSASMLALAVLDAEQLAAIADESAALTLEAMCGCARALDEKVHAARGHDGQIASAARIRELVDGSKLVERAGAVQDAYSLRCAPQVHGASRDAIRYARAVAQREINALTDNPLFFPGESEPFDLRFRDNWPNDCRGDQRVAYSAGNFHGQPIALAADFLSIAVAELANISERRTQLLLDQNHNRGLPPNLTTRPGVNSGLMIAQYTAASLVSENKVLAHPASVDSIPTAANAEDHVSMSTHAARKLGTIIENAQHVLAIELMVAAQAVDWRVAMLGGVPEAHDLGQAETQAKAFESAVRGKSSEIARSLGAGTRETYLRVRGAVEPLFADRPLTDDVRRVRAALLTAGTRS
jgi:histidine ammonia-lyase